MTTLSIVIPAYNEADSIAEIANRVLDVRQDLAQVGVGELELVVVDDGSVDDTGRIAGDIEGVHLITHEKNLGYGAALKTGFHGTSGELIGFLDADGTYPPEYFPQLSAAALNGADLVIGSRMAGARSRMPLTRRAGNLFFAMLLSILGQQKVTDSASGMRVFHRTILPRVSPLPDGLNLTPVMSTRALHEGIRVTEIPIPYDERMGDSKLSAVRDGSLFLQSMIFTALTYNPVRPLGLMGLAGVAFAVLVGLGLLAARLTGTTTIGPWGVAALFAALVMAVAGISIFALGATFNYLVTLFRRRPVQQGLFGRPIFTPSLDRHFGWLGLATAVAGLLVAASALILGIGGWEIARLWLYLLAAGMLILVGIQLVTFWILMRVLEELSRQQVETDE